MRTSIAFDKYTLHQKRQLDIKLPEIIRVLLPTQTQFIFSGLLLNNCGYLINELKIYITFFLLVQIIGKNK